MTPPFKSINSTFVTRVLVFFNFVLTKAIALDCKERKVPQFHADIDAIGFW